MGPAPARDAVFNDYARTLIRVKARQLIRRSGFCPTDKDDVEQDLTFQLLAKAGKYDPGRASPKTFADRVVNTAAAMLLRDRQRQKRAAGLVAASLEAERPSATGEVTTLGERVSSTDLARRTGADPDGDARREEKVASVHAILAQLPPELQKVCETLAGGTISSLARDLGVSRRQVRRMIAQVRSHFEAEGLEHFF